MKSNNIWKIIIELSVLLLVTYLMQLVYESCSYVFFG